MSSPRHPNDARRNTPAEGEGVPKLHAREFTVPPGWYERDKTAPSNPGAAAPSHPAAKPSPSQPPSAQASVSDALEGGRSAHPPTELRPAEAIRTAEPPVVLATELVSSAQYESAPRIDSLPTDRIDAGPTFFDSTELAALRTDPDATTPFNAEVRELQALATQPSLRARQRQAIKHRVLLLGVLAILACASALFVAGLIRNNAAAPSPSVATAAQPPPVEAHARVAKSAAKPSEPQARVASSVPPQPSQPPSTDTQPPNARTQPPSTDTQPPSTQSAPRKDPQPERTMPRRAPAARSPTDPPRSKPAASAVPTPSTEPKSKLITRTPSF